MRKAATLIELLFAIIIISIALMSVPVVIAQAVKTDEFSLNQEALLAGATKMGNILTHAWDENGTQEDISAAKVLVVSNGDSELEQYPDKNSSTRIGHFKTDKRRKFWETNSSVFLEASPIGREESGSDPNDDIDDFNGETAQLNVSVSNDYDYIKNFQMKTNVYYVDDSADYNTTTGTLTFGFKTTSEPNPTNIKMIETTIIDKDTNEPIATFRSYASNIGEYELLYRDFE